MSDSAIALPTKRFFVSMLTRDITLSDAILDLVDNCLDGALRVSNGAEVDYSKHMIAISCDQDRFRIEDDCGGIPREIAINYAFKMGREPDDNRDMTTETIGMYGVGMKRAIFKMGRDAIVKTRYDGDSFSVPISSEWLELKEWAPLPILDDTGSDALAATGTIIEVKKLYAGVSRHFTQGPFINDLKASLGEHFTFFLQRGLKMTLNGEEIQPVRVEVLVSSKVDGPAPYVFRKKIEGVLVTIVVGMNTGRSPDDEGESGFEYDRSATTAGWSIFCNDRAVIVGDKGRLTGWGDGIPLYHAQFSVISGIVEFRSTSAEKLPVTTTKRALDTSSGVWLETRAKMREAMRVWINHTNAWKNHPRTAQASVWEDSRPMQLKEAAESVLTRNPTQKQDGGLEFDPKRKGVLPEPPTKRASSRRIVFSRPIEEVREVSRALFDRDDEKPGVVGDQCFSVVLAKVRSEVGE